MAKESSQFSHIYAQLRNALQPFPSHPTLPPPPTITSDPCNLSSQTKKQLKQALDNSLAPSTVGGYKLAIRRFNAFCERENIPSHLRWPADEFVLCAFAASHAGRVTGSTVKGYLAGIRAWHIAHNAPYNGSARLAYVVNGVSSLAPSSSKRPPRPPITRRMLRLLFDHLNFSLPLDVAVFAAATVAFWGQCRLGELLPSGHNISNPGSLPLRSHFNIGDASATLFLPWTKTTKTKGATITLTHQTRPLNPVAAVKLHFLTSQLPLSAPLFSYYVEGKIIPLSKPTFIKRCNTIWTAKGLPRITGHSFRIGGTTELLLAGVPTDVVKALGRWSSDTFLVYWRSFSELAPLYVSNLPSS
ncbi:hypothetical protein M422DRAFT_24925 [Sphaerobolus stellatus SS14]|nr:hypothetical protein M422DRAFT_24925 [Sphaerobolus stellatus SS14]